MMVEGVIILFEMKCSVSYNNIVVTSCLIVICEHIMSSCCVVSITPKLFVYACNSDRIKPMDSFKIVLPSTNTHDFIVHKIIMCFCNLEWLRNKTNS